MSDFIVGIHVGSTADATTNGALDAHCCPFASAPALQRDYEGMERPFLLFGLNNSRVQETLDEQLINGGCEVVVVTDCWSGNEQPLVKPESKSLCEDCHSH